MANAKDIFQVEENLYAIETRFNWNGDIYIRSYLVIGKEGLALIDAGTIKTADQVLSLMENLGIEASQLKFILITHAHGDHVAAAKSLRDATGCLVAVHKKGAERLRNIHGMFWDYAGSFPAYFPVTDEVRDTWFRIARDSTNPDIQFEDEGFRIDLGDIQIDAIATPGHSKDSVCFYESHRHWLFSGDSICGDGDLEEPPFYRDVRAYRDSLQRIRQLPIRKLLAAHWPIGGTDEAYALLDTSLKTVDRIDSIVREVLQYGKRPLTLEDIGKEVARQIKRKYVLAALNTSKAHLIELEGQGVVEKFGFEGALYKLVGVRQD